MISPETLLRLCLPVYRYRTWAHEDIVTYWKELFPAIHACYKRIIQHEPYSDPSTVACLYVGSEHTDTCKAAYDILNYGERRIVSTNELTSVIHVVINYSSMSSQSDHMIPDEMIHFLRTFVCPSHTINQRGHKLYLIQRLEKAEQTDAPASKSPPNNVIEELEMGSEKAGSSSSTPADGTPILPVHS